MENREEMMGITVKTNVIKRNGQEVAFDISKIVNAIRKANKEVEGIHQMSSFQIQAVADNIAMPLRLALGTAWTAAAGGCTPAGAP